MLTKEFLALEEKLTRANCPEDYFGPLRLMPEGLEQLVVDKTRDFDALISKEAELLDRQDGNGDDRIRRAKRIFPNLAKWALEKGKKETYGDLLPYRVQLKFLVVDEGGTKAFLLDGTAGSDKVTSPKINAMDFEGYDSLDPVRVVRGEESTLPGYVNYYGTHAAREVFRFYNKDQRWPELCEFGGNLPYLHAKSFSIGDVVEISTTRYGSVDEFARVFSRS